MQADELGIVTSRQQRNKNFFERFPALRRHFLGKGPDTTNAKETHITVDCRTGARSFERICPPVEMVFDRPVPRTVPAAPPISPFHDNWKTPEGKRALALAERVDPMAQRVRVGDVIRAVSEATDISIAQLCGVSREKRYAHPRHIAMLLVREFRPDLSLPKVGFLFGNRDHTTVMHAERESRVRIEHSRTHRDWYDKAKALILADCPAPEQHKGAS